MFTGHLGGAGTGSGTGTDIDISENDWNEVFALPGSNSVFSLPCSMPLGRCLALQVMQVNVMGMARTIRHVVPIMRRQCF